ncbi:MAG: T9SS type A sorting domain-containing protein, partial [candidate division Zixibacteria bacterium]|nr:T9SS type A sorting domain-containing protein [candidate division Zixibacteria bacterium]
STAIPFTVNSSQFMVHSPVHATLIIYNILGQKIRTLVDGEMMPGSYQVIWDGKDDKGNKVSSGVYFYSFKAGENFETKKMIMLK